MCPKKNNIALNYFNSHVQEIAGTYFDGDERKAFRHAAFQVLATDPTFSDEQVIQMTAIDKSGDMEVDGYYVDDESETVFLFQSAGGKTRVNEAKVAKFWEAPNELLNPERMAESNNQAARELSRELDARLYEKYTISMVFASRGGFVPAARAFAHSRSTIEREVAPLSGKKKLSYSCSFRLFDLNSVAEAFFSFRITQDENLPQVVLKIESDWSYIVDHSALMSMRATVPANEIVKVFNENRFKLFLLNPRGPLANVKVNKSIMKTLDEPEGRARFHLLNNGMCATCKDFTVNGDDGRVSITDFQIVNGCQTTVALSERSEDELKEAYVDLKLVVTADEAMARNIAETSNSQTALRAKDYTSFDEKQRYLQDDFARLQPPWYYEIKRGYWSHVLGDEGRHRFKTGTTKRHIEVQPLAQASLSFFGNPSVALDRIRYVFQGIRTLEDREYYEKAFPGSIRASELILPWKCLQHILKSKDKAFPRFSNFHILWLIATMLREHYGITKDERFGPSLSLRLADTIDSWIQDRHQIANVACRQAFRRARGIAGDGLEVRDFFRGSQQDFGGADSSGLILEACKDELKFLGTRSNVSLSPLPDR